MDIDFKKPIPLNLSVEGWQNIIIDECGEPLVPLQDYKRINTEPKYFKQSISHAINNCYCREGVAKLLEKAASYLPAGYKLLIWDAWRPLEVQKVLFKNYKAVLKSQKDLDEKSLDNLTQKYVSLPSSNRKKPSPHSTGAAIDLTITDANDLELEMGTSFDYFGESAQTDFYETDAKDENVLTIRNNRRLLYNLLTHFGFTNYPHEWWHFDYGNQFWGSQVKQHAIYGKSIYSK